MLISEIISVNLAKSQPKLKQRVPSTPIPSQAKREPMINWLTAAITRRANVPHVTQDDVAIAKQRLQRNQKRVNLAYQKAQKSRF